MELKMRTNLIFVLTTISVDIMRFVKVRAYKRIRKGRIEKVRSYYRRY